MTKSFIAFLVIMKGKICMKFCAVTKWVEEDKSPRMKELTPGKQKSARRSKE